MRQRGKLTLLVFFFSICMTAALLHYYMQIRPEALRPEELFSVVHQQFQACRSNDFSSAYSQASSSFQEHWSLEQFSTLIKTDYSRILKAETVEFGPWQRQGRHAVLQVFFINHDGSVYPCIYSLINEGEGWKIDGARWVKGWPLGQRMRGIQS